MRRVVSAKLRAGKPAPQRAADQMPALVVILLETP